MNRWKGIRKILFSDKLQDQQGVVLVSFGSVFLKIFFSDREVDVMIDQVARLNMTVL
jgi:hypothetical protein